ncbi:MAG: 3-methyl-2-oxobutanoate dehydrogenase [Planctomycetota bacterium]|nr:MAG: 3-methyl-2-oxobutanoate dehydrogenase [Planctomycetota bacterium]
MPDNLIRVLPTSGRGRVKKPVSVPDEELLALYEEMLRIRIFDQRMLALQRQGRIGFFGMVLGQEGAIVGSAFATEDRDWIVPALREGGIAMIRGLPIELAVAQLIGNELDMCKGRQMPCHYTWKKGRYIAMSSVIGTQISHATGMAMAAKVRGTDEVVLGYMGDGATSANDFHAGLNFAAVYKAPVVFVCQNNQWSISVPVKKQTMSETIAAKAVAYGMPGVRVDGNDVLAVRQVVSEAVARARTGEGPTLVECVTYRRLGHSSSDDPSKYRNEAEVAEWAEKDPVDRYMGFLVRAGLWDEKADEDLKDRLAGEINLAIKKVEDAPFSAPETVYEDVFAEPDPRTVEDVRGALGVMGD